MNFQNYLKIITLLICVLFLFSKPLNANSNFTDLPQEIGHGLNANEIMTFYTSMSRKEKEKFDALTLSLFCNDGNNYPEDYHLSSDPNREQKFLKKLFKKYGKKNSLAFRFMLNKQRWRQFRHSKAQNSFWWAAHSTVTKSETAMREKYKIEDGIVHDYLINDFDVNTSDGLIKFLIIHGLNRDVISRYGYWGLQETENLKIASKKQNHEKFRANIALYHSDNQRIVNNHCSLNNLSKNAYKLLRKTSSSYLKDAYKEILPILKKNKLDTIYLSELSITQIEEKINKLHNYPSIKEYLELLNEYAQPAIAEIVGSSNYDKFFIEDDRSVIKNSLDLSYSKKFGKTISVKGLRVNIVQGLKDCGWQSSSDPKKQTIFKILKTNYVSYLDHLYSCKCEEEKFDRAIQLIRELGKMKIEDKSKEDNCSLLIKENFSVEVTPSPLGEMFITTEPEKVNSNFDQIKGNAYIDLFDESDNVYGFFIVHIPKSLIAQSKICEDAFFISAKDRNGYELFKSNDIYNNSGGFRVDDLPVEIKIFYKQDCDKKTEIEHIVIKKNGSYSIKIPE